jgi:nucleotide-binding universal stress UspA family protein
MYKKIVLAYDGSVEGQTALREGALLAKTCGAHVFLISVVAEAARVRHAESIHDGPVAHDLDDYRRILAEGKGRLERLGLRPTASLLTGEPAHEIGAFARGVSADLVIVGHRHRNMIARWWGGSNGAYLMDHLTCSLLIGRDVVSDESFAEACAAEAGD